MKCDICQQNCAFNRDDYRVDGRLHCWLCRLSYKKALAKAKKLSENDKNRHKKRSAEEALKSNSSQKMSGSGSSNNRHGMSKSSSDVPEKIAKTVNSGLIPNSSDHVVAITQLKEQIETLQKKLVQKDSIILAKDKEVRQIFDKCRWWLWLIDDNIANRSLNGKANISRSRMKCETDCVIRRKSSIRNLKCSTRRFNRRWKRLRHCQRHKNGSKSQRLKKRQRTAATTIRPTREPDWFSKFWKTLTESSM